jgi:hypothetical protein
VQPDPVSAVTRNQTAPVQPPPCARPRDNITTAMAPPVFFPQLGPLQDSMIRLELGKQRFPYVHHQGAQAIPFDVVFMIDTEPHLLVFGARGADPFAFQFNVFRNFRIDHILDDKAAYSKLVKLLGLKYDPNNPFSPAKFLTDMRDSGQIPTRATEAGRPRPEQIPAPERHVSDHDKPYFLGWRCNDNYGKRVRPENLKRTALAFGKEWADRCALRNISSCWTADEAKSRQTFDPPPERSRTGNSATER